MNIEARKLSFIQEFLQIQNEEIIDILEKLLKQKKKEQRDKNIKPMSLDQFNAEIDRSLYDSEQGNITKASELKEKWIFFRFN